MPLRKAASQSHPGFTFNNLQVALHSRSVTARGLDADVHGTSMSERNRRWIAGFALAGLASAASSLYMHYQLVADPAYTSFCDVSETVSCTQLYQSRFGSVRGIPVALGGVFWFGVTLLFALGHARGPAKSRENVSAYMLVWSTIGLSVAMYMAYASFFVLRTFCILCGVVYVAVIAVFVLSGSGDSTPMRRLPIAVVRDLGQLVRRPRGLAVTAAFIGLMAAAVLRFPEPQPLAALAESIDEPSPPPPTADQRSEFERYWGDQPRVDLGRDAGDAAVVVYKFNDYQCPACADSHRSYGPIFAKYESSHPGVVRLVVLDFPLDPQCNDHSPNGPHDAACEAAVAARIAREVGDDQARRMERWLYANQSTMSAETIVAAVEDITGVDRRTYRRRYPELIGEVRSDIELGVTLPVEATPTFIINGVVIKGGLAPQFFDQAIQFELERVGTTP